MQIRRWLWLNGLALVMFSAFLIFLVLQSIFGWKAENAELLSQGAVEVSYLTYLTSGAFTEATFENWESEFLQMGVYVLLTAFLVQKGSAESKPLKEAENQSHEPRPRKGRGRIGEFLRENGLAIALLGMFLLSFVLHLVGGTAAYNNEQKLNGQEPVSIGGFLGNAEFWFQSMQNWQSEFLAVGALVVLSIFFRQKGSPQSKKIDDPDAKTGS